MPGRHFAWMFAVLACAMSLAGMLGSPLRAMEVAPAGPLRIDWTHPTNIEGVEAGMPRAEVLRLAGEPAARLSGNEHPVSDTGFEGRWAYSWGERKRDLSDVWFDRADRVYEVCGRALYQDGQAVVDVKARAEKWLECLGPPDEVRPATQEMELWAWLRRGIIVYIGLNPRNHEVRSVSLRSRAWATE